MKNQLAKDFSSRLRTALRGAGVRISASYVAHEFNIRYWGPSISSHAARNWLLGVSVPKQDKLMVLADWLCVTPEALLFGTEPPRPADDQFTQEPVNIVDQQLISRYFKLTTEQRVTVRMVVEALTTLNVHKG
jgi:hypothetical protein